MPPILVSIAISLAISVVLTVAQMLLFPKKQSQQNTTAVPKPSDGKYNFKQNVPSLPVVLGRVKKPGDYAFLEERSGQAVHIIVMAGHRCAGLVQYYLHDEAITLDETDNIVDPARFYQRTVLGFKVGLPLETAWPDPVAMFPEIWTENHRGDGLAQLFMRSATVAAEVYDDVYQNGMPEPSAVIEGALVYDPREEAHDPEDPGTWEFSTNLALERLHHLTQPFGGRLSLVDDIYLPDWIAAADEADDTVVNRDEEEEPRYHGGLWFRYDNDQVDTGRLIDEAGEMVLYERADGRIGVHPGALVTPDIRITIKDIHSFRYDANRRISTTVLAVRGRFTDPAQVYNTVDAAIYGDPYTGDDDTQRTKTVDNQVVQSHNHCQRLQKLAMIRANAPRVSLTIDFDATSPIRNVRYRRFVRVHYPERGLDEAIVEIIGRPKLSLANLTYTFDGIVVPATLYAFDAATEEGVPGGQGDEIEPTGVPAPENFAIEIETEVVSAGQSQAYGVASWDHVSDALTYELEYQVADESEVPAMVSSSAGETEVRTPYLADGVTYRFRLRAKSNGANSEWTGYENETVVADPVPPGQPDDLGSAQAGNDVTLTWTQPNSPNLYRTELYRGTTAVFADAALIYTANAGIGETRLYVDESLSPATYYWFVRSFNASGIPSDPVGPVSEQIPAYGTASITLGAVTSVATAKLTTHGAASITLGAVTLATTGHVFEAETILYRADVVTNGGTVSDARLIVIDTFIKAEKTAGTWALTDDYWPFWAENAVQALTSLKQRRLATVSGSPTFTADRDYTFNGTSSYVNTGFVPSTHGVAGDGSNQRIGIYERANVTGGVSAGASSGTGSFPKCSIVARAPSGNMTAGLNTSNNTTQSYALSPSDSRGLKAVSRAGGGTTARGYDRGVRLTDVTGLSIVNTLTAYSIHVGAVNVSGTASSFRASQVGFLVVGAPLSDAEEAAQYANVQAWATSVGANV